MSSPRRRLPQAAPVEAFTARARTPLERCGPDDVFHDYVLDPYPPRAPSTGKLRSVSLLYEALALVGLEDEGVRIVDAIRSALGPFRTVWGIKHDETRGLRGVELYFYDFGRKHADLSIEAVRELLAPLVTVDARPPRSLDWHMFSVELDFEDLRGKRPVPAHVYVDMRSYQLRGDAMTFENVYTFHDPRREIDHVLRRLRASVHADARGLALARLMPPEMFRCHRLCVANKRSADAVYFSRVPTSAMLAFLRARKYPAELLSFVEAFEGDFDHLFWCVGMDFAGGANITKSGVYGSF